MVIGIRPSHRNSSDVGPAQDTVQESPLTQEQIEAIKERIERPKQDKATAESWNLFLQIRNLLHQMLKLVIAFDGRFGSPMTQRDRDRLGRLYPPFS